MRRRQGGAGAARSWASHLLRGVLLLGLVAGVAPSALPGAAPGTAPAAGVCAAPVGDDLRASARCGSSEVDATPGDVARLASPDRRDGPRLAGAAGCCPAAAAVPAAPLSQALRARPPTAGGGIHSPGGVARRGPPATAGT